LLLNLPHTEYTIWLYIKVAKPLSKVSKSIEDFRNSKEFTLCYLNSWILVNWLIRTFWFFILSCGFSHSFVVMLLFSSKPDWGIHLTLGKALGWRHNLKKGLRRRSLLKYEWTPYFDYALILGVYPTHNSWTNDKGYHDY